MKKLRLFQVRDTHTRKVLDQMFLEKRTAKEFRDEMNTLHQNATRFVVTFGPDHHKYNP
jgi:hypothetical protein